MRKVPLREQERQLLVGHPRHSRNIIHLALQVSNILQHDKHVRKNSSDHEQGFKHERKGLANSYEEVYRR